MVGVWSGSIYELRGPGTGVSAETPPEIYGRDVVGNTFIRILYQGRARYPLANFNLVASGKKLIGQISSAILKSGETRQWLVLDF